MSSSQAHPHPSLRQVTASAGSGKTYALTRRFLELLRAALPEEGPGGPAACGRAAPAGFGWSEIMAVTFTNKAAAEMKARIVEHLKGRALGRTDNAAALWSPSEARVWLERIMRRLDRLNVRTIDSLLNLLMTVFALELGVSPDFQPVFGVAPLFDELFDRVAARAEAGGRAERQALEQAVDTLLRLENQPGFDFSPAFRARALTVLEYRLREPGEIFADPRALHHEKAALAQDLARAASALDTILAREGIKPRKQFQDLLDACARGDPSKTFSAYMRKADLADCLLAAFREAATPSAQEAFSALRAAYGTWFQQGALLDKARGLAGMVALTDLLLAELEVFQRERDVLPAHSWPGLARRLLSGQAGVPDAFCRMGARLRHLLVDEFQDTSRDQWQALEPLAEECLSKAGSLFYVGDVKQAIYGWRGGDAALFDEVLHSPSLTAMAVPEPSSLPANWRSLRHVVEFNNRVFSRLADPAAARAAARALLGDEAPEAAAENLAQDLARAFADARQDVAPGHRDSHGYVRLTRMQAANAEDLRGRTREALEDLFQDLASRRALGDVAVLVRSNDQAALVSRWLLEMGLAVITENSLRLGEHPVVRRLLALLRFLDYPLDDLAFWELILGPEVLGLGPELAPDDLAAWVCGLEGGPLYAAFERDFPAAWARIEPFFRRAGLMGPYDCAREAVALYRLLERHPDDEIFIRRFLEVVHEAEEQGCLSLSAFLDHWTRQGAEEKVPLPENADAVRVMTMHKAKGLEFPVVVVPFHPWSWSGRGEYVVLEHGGRRLLAPLGRHLGQDWWPRAAAAAREQLNLLYVAWTRPVEELHCLIAATDRQRSSSPVMRALDLLLADEAFVPDEAGREVLEWGLRPAPGDRPRPDGIRLKRAEPGPGPAETPTPMAWLPRLKIRRRLDRAAAQDDLWAAAGGFGERDRGSLVHAAMDRLRLAALGNAKAEAEAVRWAVASALAEAERLPRDPDGVEALRAQAEACLAWALTVPGLRRALAPGTHQSLAEQPILDAAGAEHRPDLLVLDKEQTMVVEYKTGAERPKHVDQVRSYLGLMRDMGRPGPGLRGLLVYLDLRCFKEVLP